ncbi:ParE family toxin-like protein [Pantoea stewartii]|uniref:ParE-like toxin domain-containing protein n=1 Tax=Pantoea stewartii subsp. stewartii DC283 TaxID=660596 RepID=A0ABM6KA15_PANSE|nr:hypothetical protein [Pantoea stewartii]ARF51125.1 hypothetical protein DSJ_18590 [Pantoea stewartii subsp. stewartii DC283]KAB0555126.1 hypothetical protein F7Q90_09935 [Pantoea stewartii subsp. stewartii]
MSLTTFKAPEWVIVQATKKLSQYRKRRIFACRIRSTGYLSLAVNPRWRLLSRNNGKDWQLMTHETYSKCKDGKK